jgi:hypothetical protein
MKLPRPNRIQMVGVSPPRVMFNAAVTRPVINRHNPKSRKKRIAAGREVKLSKLSIIYSP